MKNIVLTILIFILFSFGISLDSFAKERASDALLTARMIYGLAKANGESADPYEREAYAIESIAEVWEELRQKGQAESNKSLDELVSVNKAGYIKEYTWHYLKKKNWKKPRRLKTKEFEDWSKENLFDHELSYL
ncbi:hypothetical protein [Arenicella xantha]|uniref:Uncharacterized protein n=1 Tax=Arenicella xantha TaxID=644221 RepID=A0A395JHU3_9GAMM|nr:hypothetical protein [Arenicella xantha]RBP49585.1 hypothetical protein DFR28_10310 [Arenicella xantha]